MDNTLDDIVLAAKRCEQAAVAFDTEPVSSACERLHDSINAIGASWSGSWLGNHSSIYMKGLRPLAPGEVFDKEWGTENVFSNRTRGPWCIYPYEAVADEIIRRASLPDMTVITQAAKRVEESFEQSRDELLPIFDALLAEKQDTTLKELRQSLAGLSSHISRMEFVEVQRPKQFFSRDYQAVAQSMQGVQAPHHISFQCWLLELQSYSVRAKELAKIGRHAERYLKQRYKMKGATVAKTDGKIFIGHGHSSAWRELQDFIQNRLKLEPDEFNRESTAGITTKERLEHMLGNACFAFLVMTAEDEHADTTKHARENVIHEVGLFQGRLGFRRAIVMLEEGCTEFSNITGLGQIRFPKNNIKAAFEEVRTVLEREGII